MKNICLSFVLLGVVLGRVPVCHCQVLSAQPASPGPQVRPATADMGNVFDLRPADLRHPGVPVPGTLFDPSGAPAPGVLMCVLPIGPPESDFKSDAAGRFVVYPQGLPFGGPPPGYRGSWGSPIPEYFLLARDFEHNLVALVQIQEHATNLDARLQPGFTLSGSVVDAQGAPVKTATLRLDMYPSPMWPAFIHPTFTVDEHGAFNCRALPQAHVYYLSVSAPGFDVARVELGTNRTGTNTLRLPPIILAPAAPAAPPRPADQKIEGMVMNADGRPVSGAKVRIEGEGQPNVSTVTDATGRFVLEHVCTGPVRVFGVYFPAVDPVAGGASALGITKARGGDTNVVVTLGQTPENNYGRGNPAPNNRR